MKRLREEFKNLSCTTETRTKQETNAQATHIQNTTLKIQLSVVASPWCDPENGPGPLKVWTGTAHLGLSPYTVGTFLHFIALHSANVSPVLKIHTAVTQSVIHVSLQYILQLPKVLYMCLCNTHCSHPKCYISVFEILQSTKVVQIHILKIHTAVTQNAVHMSSITYCSHP